MYARLEYLKNPFSERFSNSDIFEKRSYFWKISLLIYVIMIKAKHKLTTYQRQTRKLMACLKWCQNLRRFITFRIFLKLGEYAQEKQQPSVVVQHLLVLKSVKDGWQSFMPHYLIKSGVNKIELDFEHYKASSKNITFFATFVLPRKYHIQLTRQRLADKISQMHCKVRTVG